MNVPPLTTDEKNMVAQALFIAATSYRRQADDLRNTPGISGNLKAYASWLCSLLTERAEMAGNLAVRVTNSDILTLTESTRGPGVRGS